MSFCERFLIAVSPVLVCLALMALSDLLQQHGVGKPIDGGFYEWTAFALGSWKLMDVIHWLVERFLGPRNAEEKGGDDDE